MSYVDENLLKDENVVYRARLHPIVYTPAFVTGSIGLAFVVVGLAVGGDTQGALMLLGGLFLVLSAILALVAYLNVASSEFTVTNRRVIIKVGWLRHTTLELFLPKIEGVAVDQGIIGRMFDFGTIGVRGTGGSRERFPNISAPLEFRRQIQMLIPEQ